MTLGKQIRVLILLLLLLAAILYTKAQGHFSTNWEQPLEVVIYPVNFGQDEKTEQYITTLDNNSFSAIDDFTHHQAIKWGVNLDEPTRTRLGDEIIKLPPAPPELDANLLSIMLWSLQFRYWAWVHTPDEEANFTRIRIFVLYHQAEKNDALDHSIGLSKGLMAYVNAFATEDQTGQNNIVIAHELLHTVGALDKYSAYGEPLFPQGYAEHDEPRYPQKYAEIMAGKIPFSATSSFMPIDLRWVVVGEETAKEINWLQTGNDK